MQNVSRYVNDDIEEDFSRDSGSKRAKYFRGGSWGRYLDLVPQICRYSDSVLLILGDKGQGKSALIDTLIDEMADNFKVAKLQGNIQSNLSSVMEEVAKGFSLPWGDSANTDTANSAPHDVEPWVLIVDDAHEYSVDIIQSLLDLSLSNTTDVKLHLIMLANKEFESVISKLKLRNEVQGQVHVLELEPYSKEETEAFLWQQWKVAGNESSMPINGDALDKLFKLSGGKVNKIIEISNKILSGEKLQVSDNKFRLPKLKHYYQVGVGATVLILLYFCVSYFLDSKVNKKTAVELPSISKSENIVKERPNKVTSILSNPSSSVTPVKQDEKIRKSAVDENKVVNIEAKSTNKLAEVVKDSAKISPEDMAKREREIARLVDSKITSQNESKDEVASTTIVDTENVSIKEDKPVQIDEKLIQPPSSGVLVKDLHATVTKAEPYNKEALTSTKVSTPEPSVIQGKASKVIEKKHEVKPKVSNVYSKNEEKMLNVPKEHYAYQILGSSRQDKLEEFISVNGLDKGSYYYHSKLNGKDWYVLIYGDYLSQEEAKKALSGLSNDLQNMKPWLRSYESIHTSIKNSKRK